MAAIQLNFSLRTSANCKTVHLLGSWDNYAGQLPLSKDSSKAGSWKGCFRFQSSLIKQGQRYWYYYILDGYHVSHDPAREHIVEPTTSRKLNVLDVPASGNTVKSSRVRPSSQNVAKGRPVSPTRIISPQPFKPGQTKHIIATSETTNLDQIAAQLSRVQLQEDDESSESDSDGDSDVPSLTSSRSSASSSSRSSSVSSSSSCCTCERYGITRKGDRVRLDCGGSRCGYSSAESSECGSDSENETYRVCQTRRQGELDQSNIHPSKRRPVLRIYTNLKYGAKGPGKPPDDNLGRSESTASLRSLLKERYKELAPEQMPPHLHSPDAIAPSLTPALVQFPTSRGRSVEVKKPPLRQKRPLQLHELQKQLQRQESLQRLQERHHADPRPPDYTPSDGWKQRSSWTWKT